MMNKKILLPLAVAAAAGVSMTSCSKKLGALSSDYFTTTPQVLEAIGGKVPVTINGTFPEKYMKKKAVVSVTPVLRYEGGEAIGETASFQGEKVEGNNQTISYKVGGNYTMRNTFGYVPEMAKSEFYLTFNATVGKKEVEIPEVKIADGVIATSELVGETLNGANTGVSTDAFQREIQQAKEANIMFLINQAEVRAKELKSEGIQEFTSTMKQIESDSTLAWENIEISSYASPDGKEDFNEKLAQKRQANTEKYMQKEMKDNNVDAALDAKYTAEDWEGFQELVSKSNIQDKDLILRVLGMYTDPEQREQEIRNLSSVFTILADEILPQLRRSRLTLNYKIIGKSDDELKQISTSNPSELSLEELLYAATLTDDNDVKESIYKTATEQYPDDYRAFNNLAALYYAEGDYTAAASYVAQAAKLNSSDADVKVNQALLALKDGNQSEAQTLLGNAGNSAAASEALGNLYLMQGEYQKAVNAFGNAKTNSAALAQILTSDYNKAKSTLEGVENKDAYTSYLAAILAARTNNADSAISNLKEAIAQDSSLATKAATDLEFSKLVGNAAFEALVK